jgi:hypothetical protein
MAEERLPPPGMTSDEDNDFIDSDEDSWDGIYRCMGCDLEIEEPEESYTSTCDECYVVSVEYIKIGIDHMKEIGDTSNFEFDRNNLLTVRNPVKRELEKSLSTFFEYLGLHNNRIMRYESGTHKYDIHLEYLVPIITKPRLKPYKCHEKIMIRRQN